MKYKFIFGLIFLLLKTPLVLFYLVVLIRFHTLEALLCLIGSIVIIIVAQLLLSQLDRLNHIEKIRKNIVERYPKATFKEIAVSEYVPFLYVAEYFKRKSAAGMLRELDIRWRGLSFEEKTRIILIDNKEHPFSNVASFYNSQEESFIFVSNTNLPTNALNKYVAYHEIAHASFMSRKMEVDNVHLQYQLVAALFVIPFSLLWSLQSVLLFIIYLLLSSEFVGKFFMRKIIKSRTHAELYADQIALDIMTFEDRKELRKVVRKSLSRGRLLIYDDEMEYPANIMRIAKLGNLLKQKDEANQSSIEEELEVNQVQDSKFDTLWFSLFVIVLALNAYAPSYYHVAYLFIIAVLGYIIGIRTRRKWIKTYIHLMDKMKLSA